MTRELVIGKHHIHDESNCYVIAEIGHNHQGSVDTAKEMIKVAKECGAHAIKFQKRDNKALYTKALFEKSYDNEFSYGATYGQHREALELSPDQYKDLIHFAHEIDIDFIATAFDFPSADLLNGLNVTAFKAASGDAKSIPLLKHIASFGKPFVISTGGCQIEDVHRIYDSLKPLNTRLSILQCTAAYPSDYMHLDLNVIQTYRKLFPDTVIGLSDHTNGISMGPAAYVLGARIMEKHFTLNRALKGTDHGYSLEPVGLKKLVRDLNRTRIALGSATKRTHECEKSPITKMSKKMVARHDLPKGYILKEEDIEFKSPGDGLHPHELERVIGKKLIHDLEEDDDILFEALEN
ncbi:MAG TPA: N-acetylneuraminate synthase [Nitrospirae bacterium]|nr:N-acetylneuraminate synthase [Nitrospirota bacterium]